MKNKRQALVGSTHKVIIILSVFWLAAYNNYDITIRAPVQPARSRFGDSHATTFPMRTNGRSGLNATVTLVKPTQTESSLLQIVKWIEDVKHLARHVCILTESSRHSAWLHAALDAKLDARLRERVRLIDVSVEFEQCAEVAPSSKVCHETEMSKQFGIGYKHMCRLWFSALWPHLSEYDFILRIDIDNKYLEGGWPTDIHYFGTVTCVSEDSDDVTVGLSETIWEHNVHSQKRYPYTNVMFVNVLWATTNVDLQKLFQQVEETKCICINRWGDLPLWGETLARLGLRPEMMSGWKYTHASHNNATVVSDGTHC